MSSRALNPEENPRGALRSDPEAARGRIRPDGNLTVSVTGPREKRRVPSDRRIPAWAAGVLSRLALEHPAVVTRDDIAAHLRAAGSDRDVDPTVRELQRLGWLMSLHLKGVWAYVPPGESQVIDPYIDLRGWKAREADAVFALAGEAVAWHLGYTNRPYTGAVAVWIPEKTQLPSGLRAHLSVVTLGWLSSDAVHLGPTTQLLHRRRLDVLSWAGGLPGFGPEAFVVQLAARPASFRAWADLVPHLNQLAEDCDIDRLVELIGTKSTSTWQRAAYLIYCGGREDDGLELLDHRPRRRLVKVQYGEGPNTVWAPRFQVADRLIAPLLKDLGKA
jgi:hypothetical protein